MIHLELVNRKMSGLSPYSKYFFINWIKKYKEGEVVLPIEKLSQESGLSVKLVRKSIKELLNIGLLHRERNAKLKGHPDFTYHAKNIPGYLKVKERFKSFERNEKETAQSPKDKLLNSMLEIDALNNLSIPQKLLLIILWIKSTDQGIVDKIGAGQLADAIGCSKDTVKRHLKALTEKNLLVVICKGFTAKNLFGVKGSIYLLNPPSNYSYFISGLPLLSEKKQLILDDVREIFILLKQQFPEDAELLNGLEADFNNNSVSSYFLYWFWQYLYSNFSPYFNGEPLKPYLRDSLENITPSNEKIIAKSLFSKSIFELWKSNTPILSELAKKIHGLVFETGIEINSQGKEEFFGTNQGKMSALLPDGAVYFLEGQ